MFEFEAGSDAGVKGLVGDPETLLVVEGDASCRGMSVL